MKQVYTISGSDNDSYMCSWGGGILEEIKDIDPCPKCGYRTDFEYINPKFKVKRRTYDFSYTYDGYCIVSLKFKETCLRAGFKNLKFVNLPGDNDFFDFRPEKTVEFDVLKRKTRFIDKCTTCGNYEEIIGATPAFIKGDIPCEVFRSDISFGSGNSKSPIIFITEEVKNIFRREKLTSIYPKEIST